MPKFSCVRSTRYAREEEMNVSGIGTTLYPIVLAVGNIGLGIGLYDTGILLLALVLWLTGTLVLVGFVSSLLF